MLKNKKLMVPVALAAFALIAISIFGIMELNKNGINGSKESNETMKEFNKYYNSKDKKIIYYASTSCYYCSLETPILEALAEDYDLDYYYVDTAKLNLSTRNEIMKKLKIEKHATPITVIVEKGKVIDKVEGYAPSDKYTKFFIENDMLPKDAVYSGEKNITFIDYSKYEKLISGKNKSIIVVGQTTCRHCIAFKPAMNTVAGKYNVTINYLNLTDLDDTSRSSFFDSLKKLGFDDEEFLKDGSFGTPTTLVVQNNKIVNYITGERTTSQFAKELAKFGLIKE